MNGNNSVIQAFGNHFLSAFGFESKRILEHIPSEVENIRNEKIWVEDLFRLEDGTLLQLLYHSRSDINERDLWEFAIVHFAIFQKYRQKIRAIIVLSPETQYADLKMDKGSIRYNPDALWLSKWDGDQIAREINDKVQWNGELTDEDQSILAMLPFMNTQVSRIQRVEEAVQISNKLRDQEKRDLVIQLMQTMAGKLLLGEDYGQVVKALR